MKKLKFNPFVIPIAIGLIGIGKYSLDTYEAKKFEIDQANKYVNETVVDNSVDESEEVIVTEEPIQNTETEESNDEQLIEEDTQETEELSTELLDDGYIFKDIDFAELNNTNEDVVGWLSVDGVINDFPIVQGSDNSYYLHTGLDGSYSSAGVPFIDYRNNSFDDELNDLTVLYGHHMKHGNGFSNLCNYKTKGFIDEHPYGVYYAENGDVYMIKFFAGIVVDGTDVDVLNVSNMDEEEFYEYIDFVNSNTYFNTDIVPEYGDKMLALVTCSYETNNSRFVLYGVLDKQLIKENNDVKTLIKK